MQLWYSSVSRRSDSKGVLKALSSLHHVKTSRIRTHATHHRTRKIPTDKTKKVHAAEPAEAYFHVFCWSYAAKAPKPSELAAVLKRSARSLGLMGSAGLLSGLPQGSQCSTYFLAVDVYGSSGDSRDEARVPQSHNFPKPKLEHHAGIYPQSSAQALSWST